MEVLIIYYSLQGNTEAVAQAIKEVTGGDLVALKPRLPIPAEGLVKYMKGTFQVLLKQKPALQEVAVNLEKYDLVFLGTPVWAFNYAAPIRTFLAHNSLAGKNVALFCTHEGNPGNSLKRLACDLGNVKIIGELDLKEPRKDKSRIAKVQEWAGGIIRQFQ